MDGSLWSVFKCLKSFPLCYLGFAVAICTAECTMWRQYMVINYNM